MRIKDLEETVDGLLRSAGTLLDEMFRSHSPQFGPFLVWFRTTLLEDCSAFAQESVRRFEASDRSFAVFEVDDVRLRFMRMAFEKRGCPKALLWNMLEYLRQFLDQRRVVREGGW